MPKYPGRPMISNYGTPTEKPSEFLQNHLQAIMQESLCCIKAGDVPGNAFSMTADVVGPYSSIPHKAGLKALKNALRKREQKHIPTEKLINMTESVLKNNFF